MNPLRIAAITAAVLVVATVVAGCGSGGPHGKPQTRTTATAGPGRLGPELVPVPSAPALAPAGAPRAGRTVDGIASTPIEQVAFHVHAHLTVFVDGRPRQIPAGIGIRPPRQIQSTPNGAFVAGGAAFAWLHTHAADGIVHIESPVQRRYTLGQFFDVWGQPLGRKRVGPASGRVTAFVDGRRYSGDPRAIPLVSHAQIQLDVGTPVAAPASISFPGGL